MDLGQIATSAVGADVVVTLVVVVGIIVVCLFDFLSNYMDRYISLPSVPALRHLERLYICVDYLSSS